MARVIVGVTGSIAAVKAPELVRLLTDKGHDVSCVLTSSAKEFVSAVALATFSGKPVAADMFGPDAYAMPHIRMANEADAMVIAPLSATVLARCAFGLAEDLVTLTYLTVTIPVIAAPAMHTTMWEHPATRENIKILTSRGVHFVGPQAGLLADSTKGEGRMAEPGEIVRTVESVLAKKVKK